MDTTGEMKFLNTGSWFNRWADQGFSIQNHKLFISLSVNNWAFRYSVSYPKPLKCHFKIFQRNNKIICKDLKCEPMPKTHTKRPDLRAHSCCQSWESWRRENQLSDTQASERHLIVAHFLAFPVLFLKYERLPHYSLKASDSGKVIFSINHCNANTAVYRLIFKRKTLHLLPLPAERKKVKL